ncbi:MAG: ATP-binding protein, partial [Myxococcota bacterium]
PHTFVCKDGTQRDVLLSATREQTHQGGYLRSLIVLQDVTELNRAQAELKLRSEELERSNLDLEQFAYAASHDLQEPLRKITAFLTIIQEDDGDRLSEESKEYFGYVQNAALRMKTLVSDLLNFSRVQRPRAMTPVDLNVLMHHVLSDLSLRLEETSGVVDVLSLPTIDADASQIRRLLQNLVDNALKFHRPEHPPQVRIEATEEGAWCHLTVADNGIGFDMKYADRIFGVFKRLHGRGSYNGTGIGLALCRRIVQYHGGSIAVWSQPEQGTTFTVRLPIHHKVTHPTVSNT